MLPKIDTPIFDLELPISKLKISFRPFLIKEQKILLMAGQSDEKDFLFKNIKQIIKNCCITEVDIDNLSIIDLEYFFLQLRAKSVGEIVETKYKCENFIEEKGDICGNLMDVEYNILDTVVDMNGYNDLIPLTDKIGLKMKLPSYDVIENNFNKIESDEIIFVVIKNSIEYIYDEDNMYYIKDTTEEELNDFIDSLSVVQVKKIREFFDHIPVLKKIFNVKCGKCGFEHTITIKGIVNFFG